jgi:hypothetical protein
LAAFAAECTVDFKVLANETEGVEEQDRSRRLGSHSYGLASVRIGRTQGCVRCIKCKQTGGQQADRHLGRDCKPMKKRAKAHSFYEI